MEEFREMVLHNPLHNVRQNFPVLYKVFNVPANCSLEFLLHRISFLCNDVCVLDSPLELHKEISLR